MKYGYPNKKARLDTHLAGQQLPEILEHSGVETLTNAGERQLIVVLTTAYCDWLARG